MSFKKQDIKNIYPLTPVQEGMLFHSIIDDDSIAYMQQATWRIEGSLQPEMFLQAWNTVISNHDILRTVFSYMNSDRPLQIVLKERPIKLNFIDLASHNYDADEKEAICREYRKSDQIRPFELGTGPLLRLSLVHLNNNEYEAIVSHHHILLDGWSFSLIVGEFIDIYKSLYQGAAVNNSPGHPFSHYIRWLEKQPIDDAEAYWSNHLAGFEDENKWCFVNDKAASSNQITTSKTVESTGEWNGILDRDKTQELQKLALNCNITLNAILQTVVGVVLQRCYNQNDVIFGSVVSGRPADLAMVESTIGNFINTIPCRIITSNGLSIVSLVKKTHEDNMSSNDFHHFPLTKIQKNSLSAGLLNVSMAFENYPVDGLLVDNITTEEVGFSVVSATNFDKTHYDLDIQFHPSDELHIRVIYDKRRLSQSNVDQFVAILYRVCDGFVDDCSQSVTDIDLLRGNYRRHVLTDLISTRSDLEENHKRTILSLFNQQVLDRPHSTAISDNVTSLSYRELDCASSKVAHKLISLSIPPQSLVGLCTERSVNLIIAMLGILKANCAYVPLNDQQPVSRTSHQLNEACINCLVTDRPTSAGSDWLRMKPSLQLVCIEDCEDASGESLEIRQNQNDLAYAIYTSGSSGLPKGVLVEHISVVNLVSSLAKEVYRDYQDNNQTTCIALIADSIFDASIQQIFSSLLLGHHLLIVDNNLRHDCASLAMLYEANGVAVSDCTPSLLDLWLQTGQYKELGLDYLLVGGEALKTQAVRCAYDQSVDTRIVNVYGPSECCVDITAYPVDPNHLPNSEIVPLGSPIRNTQLYVLDVNQQLVPQGMIGEIYMAGDGQCRGYLDREELQKEKFVFLPHISCQRLYRTGDKGYWDQQAQLNFVGRTDNQVKVRGYRIELEEIDAILIQHPGIHKAQTHYADLQLSAYLILNTSIDGDVPNTNDLRDFLSQSLPDYMLPHAYYTLDEFALSSSGKSDRRALANNPSKKSLHIKKDHAQAITTEEQVLCEAWTSVLGTKEIGISDNYFALGGDSIKAIQILSVLNRKGYNFSVRELFQNPTISLLSRLIRPKKDLPIVSTNSASAPITPIQERFFLLHEACLHRFNHGILIKFDAPSTNKRFQFDALHRSLSLVYQQHLSLRLKFVHENGQWLQTLSDHPLDFTCIDLQSSSNAIETMTETANQLQGTFEPRIGKMFSATLFSLADGDRLLLLAHHLVIDGVSWQILMQDLSSGYNQALEGKEISVPTQSTTYIQWANRLQRFSKGESILADIPYWATIEEKAIKNMDLDFTRDIGEFDYRYSTSRNCSDAFDSDLTLSVLTAANEPYKTTTEDLLLTALARSLFQITRNPNHCLLMESHGRDDFLNDASSTSLIEDPIDLGRCTGWFTCIWPFFLQLPPVDDLSYQIKSIKDRIRRVPRKGLSYYLLKCYADKRTTQQLSFNLKPNVSFNYLGELDSTLNEKGLVAANEAIGEVVHSSALRPVAVEISAWVVNKQLHFSITNCPDFTSLDCNNLLVLWQQETRQIIEHCLTHQDIEISPSDLTYSSIDLDELEGIIS